VRTSPVAQTAEFDVAVTTHDGLRRGVTALQYRRVVVLVDDQTSALEASLAALQLASCGDDVVATDVLWRL
jgi:hypothetical protein